MDSRYEVTITWSQEDACYVAAVPDLPGCMADGESYQEALAHIEVVLQEWLDTAKELGRTIPEPTVRIPPHRLSS